MLFKKGGACPLITFICLTWNCSNFYNAFPFKFNGNFFTLVDKYLLYHLITGKKCHLLLSYCIYTHTHQYDHQAWHPGYLRYFFKTDLRLDQTFSILFVCIPLSVTNLYLCITTLWV